MRRTPGFTAVAVLTLGLGIGANTAIFSVLYGVWLSPVKYARPDQLVDVSRQQLTGRRFLGGTSYPDLADWRVQSSTIEDFGLHRYTHQVNISGGQGAEEVIGHRVSANLFGLLGVSPVLGHPLNAGADRGAGPRQALISYTWWKRRFGGDADVAGKEIRVNDELFTITGVMPRGFEFPPMGSAAYRPVIWMSLNVPAEQERSRAFDLLAVIARLKPGVTSYAVARRTKEIGIRMAVGATPTSVLVMVAKETLLLAVTGAVVGIGATAATARLLARFLYGVRPAEPLIVAGVAIALVAIVVGSAMFPARRATHVDLTAALRKE